MFSGLSKRLASAQVFYLQQRSLWHSPRRRGILKSNFPSSVLPGGIQDMRARRPSHSHTATPGQLTLHSSAEMFQTNNIFLKWIALEQSFLKKLVLLQGTYFPWRSSRLKSRCKCYKGSDTATSSPLIAKENLQKITHETFTIWNSNANSHYDWNRRMKQTWKSGAVFSPINCTMTTSVKLAFRGSVMLHDLYTKQYATLDVKVCMQMHINQRLAELCALQILWGIKTMQSTAYGFLQLSHHFTTLLVPTSVPP